MSQELPSFLAGMLLPVDQLASDEPRADRNPVRSVLTPALDWRHMEWLCSTIPQMTHLRVHGLEDSISVRGFLKTDVPPTGTPPLRQGCVLRMDAKDARVCLAIG